MDIKSSSERKLHKSFRLSIYVFANILLGMKQYIDILQYLLLQYNTIWPIENIDILHIAVYCNILLVCVRYYIVLFLQIEK